MRSFFYSLFFALPPILLAGCSSNIPQSIRTDVGEPLSISQVQADPRSSNGKLVRWGGEILSVINYANNSDVVVLRRALFRNGEPKRDGGEGKRFVARMQGFVDPADFSSGQRLTVTGHLRGLKTILIGEYAYLHPIVKVVESHRWADFEPTPDPPWHNDPLYCDPFQPWGYGYPRPWWPDCW